MTEGEEKEGSVKPAGLLSTTASGAALASLILELLGEEKPILGNDEWTLLVLMSLITWAVGVAIRHLAGGYHKSVTTMCIRPAGLDGRWLTRTLFGSMFVCFCFGLSLGRIELLVASASFFNLLVMWLGIDLIRHSTLGKYVEKELIVGERERQTASELWGVFRPIKPWKLIVVIYHVTILSLTALMVWRNW